MEYLIKLIFTLTILAIVIAIGAICTAHYSVAAIAGLFGGCGFVTVLICIIWGD